MEKNNNNPQPSSLQDLLGKPTRNDLIYAIIMVLMLVFGFIGGTLVQMTSLANKCNLHFNEWIEENCYCSDEIKAGKQKEGWTMNVDTEVPEYGIPEGS